jgi:putative DNA primase/helicase
MLDAALAWWDAGCSVTPTRTDGSKAPAGRWRRYQEVRASRRRVRAWFVGGHPGMAVVCGAVSGGLEMLELEGRAVHEGMEDRLQDLMADAGLSPLWTLLTRDGYAERTPSSGLHLLYRIEGGVPPNTKLAQRPATPAELAAAPECRVLVLAETRGEGGVTVVAPSHGPVHPSGRPWTTMHGSIPGRIPTISRDQRDALISVVRQLDAMPPAAAQPAPTGWGTLTSSRSGLLVGEDFEARTDWAQLLEPEGWTLTRTHGATRYWARPGKPGGVSATTGRASDRDRLWVWSTSTPFPAETPITKFHAYAVLRHGGDHRKAAAALRHAGYSAAAPASEADTGPTTPPASAEVRSSPPPPPRLVVGEGVPGPEAWGPTEDGLAQALVAAHGEVLRYVPQRGKWLLWNGYRWVWDDAQYHRELIRALLRRLPNGRGWARFRSRALTAVGVSGVARLAQSDPAVVVGIGDLDAHPDELCTPAGIVDLRTGQLRAPDPSRLHTRCTPIGPAMGGHSLVWERFLRDTFGDDTELEGYVQRLLGVSAVGAVREHVLPFAYGPGANGKTTLLEAAMFALGRGGGGYAMSIGSEVLMARRHAEHPVELAQLTGVRLVVCSEVEPGRRFAEGRVKSLTGGDAINARWMRQDPFTFVPSHTLWLAANHHPPARTGGPAFWRRLRLLPFTRVVPPERQDKHLLAKLERDAAVVLAWLVRGAVAYHRDGLTEPASVRSATRAYELDQDSLGRFVAEYCRHTPGDMAVRVATTMLRETYQRWCAEGGEEPVSAKRLTQELRERFGVRDTKGAHGQRFYAGIGLLDEPTLPT